MKRIIIIFTIILIYSVLSGCRSFFNMNDSKKPIVILTHNKRVFQLAILLKDHKLKVNIRPRDPLPFSSNASAAVWIGNKFPYKKAITAIQLSRKYYRDLRYFALSDIQADRPKQVHYQLFIGGSTETALLYKLKAWHKQDFNKLKIITTKEEFHKLILSKYPGREVEEKKREKKRKRKKK